MPTGFITQEGAKIYNWKPIEGSILAQSKNFSSALDLTKETLQKLQSRYELVEKWIQEKKLICAKDFSALCPLKSLFEMCLGRKVGIRFNDNISYNELAANVSSLGGFHLVFAPHFDFEKEIPSHLRQEIIEIGQTTSNFSFGFKDQEQNLETFRKSYHQESEQLWA
jgi:phosphoribosylformylglycinamidine (FGAM) synthase-like enzyme